MSLTDEWIKKMWSICRRECHSAKKEKTSVICSNVDGPRDYHPK